MTAGNVYGAILAKGFKNIRRSDIEQIITDLELDLNELTVDEAADLVADILRLVNREYEAILL